MTLSDALSLHEDNRASLAPRGMCLASWYGNCFEPARMSTTLGVTPFLQSRRAACERVHAPANDAYMRDLQLFAPHDCMVSNTLEDNAYALRQIETVMKGDVTPSSGLTFVGSKRRSRR